MRVSAFLIFVLMLGCGKTDSGKGGKGSDVDKTGADVMKSGVSEGPSDSMSGSQGAKVTGGTGAKSDTGPGNASNPAVVKNDGKTAKPLTPVVKKETPVWDWPVKAKYDIPKCRKLYFHNENLVSDIHSGGKTAMVYRYRDGKLEFKKDIWVGNVRFLWPLTDGGLVSMDVPDKHYAGLKNDKKFLKNRISEDNHIASLGNFPVSVLKSGMSSERFKFIIFNEKLDKNKVTVDVGWTTWCDLCQYFINGENSFYFLWVDGYGEWKVVRIESKTGKILERYEDIRKKSHSNKAISDKIRENSDSCTELDSFKSAPNLFKSLYKIGKLIVTANISEFDNTKTYKVAAGECLFGKADILITGKNEKNPTSLYDEELKKLIKPHCKKAPLVFVNKYRIQNRPGGGFVVNFTIGVKPLDRRYLAKAGSYYREYSGEGKPIGPVIKTQSEVEILSENHY
ncbi:hypothetical protein KKF97_06250, partial [Myxococcota bacterium]|nr:hypothetical protein [Myxococcota bacterium]